MALVKSTSSGQPVELEGLQEESFELDLSSTDVLISLLANMYARPAFSSLREIIQNAKDSGTNRILVTLPQDLSPELVVRDFGRGMNEADMRQLLKRVGASSKRGNVAMAGHLGIGSIAPMSVADSMSIHSYKDGQMTVLTAWKNDAGDIKLAIVPAVPSNEPTGTKVTVPVHSELFRQLEEGINVFRFSPELAKLLVIDEVQAEPYAESFSSEVKVGEHLVRFRVVDGTTSVLPGALVLMNGIPMGASLERFTELKEFHEFLASREASIGRGYAGRANSTLVIDIPPSAGLSFLPPREVLAVTRLNTAFLANACTRFLAAGSEKLDKEGLHLGCEAAVLGSWKQREMELRSAKGAKKNIDYSRVAADELEKELNKTSKNLQVQLRYTYWMSRQIPVVQLQMKIPNSSVCEPRILESRKFYGRNGSVKWSLSTTPCTPIDYNDYAKGWNYPYALTSKVVVVTHAKLEELGADRWSGIIARDDNARMALFELANTFSGGSFSQTTHVLLVGEDLPKDHPLRTAPHASFVELEEHLKTFVPNDKNPLKPVEDEEDDDTGGPKAPRQRRLRTFITKSGHTSQSGLPKNTPFNVVITWRDGFGEGYSWLKESWGGPVACVPAWLTFFERAGIASDVEAVCLTQGASDKIRREHVELTAALSEAMETYVSELTKEERQWLPFAMFRELLALRNPVVLELLEGRIKQLQKNQKKLPQGLDLLARMLLPSPSDKTTRFVAAWKKAVVDIKTNPYSNGDQLAVNWIPWLEYAHTPAELAKEELKQVFGLRTSELATPAMALRRWLVQGSADAMLLRLFWMHHQNDKSSRLSQAEWACGRSKPGAIATPKLMLQLTEGC